MRLGRVVFLAGLAPLLGLAAALTAHPHAIQAVSAVEAPDSLASLLRTVVVLVSGDSDARPASLESPRPSPQFVLALDALALTPLRHSLWMVERQAAQALPDKSPLRTQLRC